ncbi:hypothetical protein SASPL_146841 [Salvia splendens]|uniref:Uncharacterized protein n=1 Tax=Salvia splendens TaxID=180675 RepID=A0A8X8WCW2_SALSN|nr:uncharacterized protein LOC121776391 [Salvia splendens]KAG6392617.1 hypothetical protein SASPL_146841 [Salvia splendens]
MAVEVLPDSPSAEISPRISFSHDLLNDAVPIEHYVPSSSSSSIDFDFCVFRESFDHESSSADELFSDGKILPIEIKKRSSSSIVRSAAPPLPPPPRMNPIISGSERQNQRAAATTTSFWPFKRSASLNCGSGYARTLCPLPLLSRSNSTGSTASVKRSNQKQNFQNYSLPNSVLKEFPSSNYHKPSVKKVGYSPYNGAVKVNPVLNVPSANLFGLGSIFSGGREKGKKKGFFSI